MPAINPHWHLDGAPRRSGLKQLPRLWFFTDDRLGAGNLAQLAKLPRGTGVVLRARGASWSLAQARHICRARGLIAVVSGQSHQPEGAAGRRRPASGQIITASAHSRAALIAALRGGADLVFVSPVFPTASHPRGAALGVLRFALMVRGHAACVVALGGITPQRARRLRSLGLAGLAAIDGWR